MTNQYLSLLWQSCLGFDPRLRSSWQRSQLPQRLARRLRTTSVVILSRNARSSADGVTSFIAPFPPMAQSPRVMHEIATSSSVAVSAHNTLVQGVKFCGHDLLLRRGHGIPFIHIHRTKGQAPTHAQRIGMGRNLLPIG